MMHQISVLVRKVISVPIIVSMGCLFCTQAKKYMDSSFIYQVVLSFVVGGAFITLISIIAEKSSEHVAGIILMFPSTIVLGYFFLGLTTSAAKVAEVVPATLVPLGIVNIATLTYIYVACFFCKYFSNKIVQILFTYVSSSIIWFCMAGPFAIWKINNLAIGVAGFFLLTGIAHYILNRDKSQSDVQRPAYRPMQIVLRAVFMGSLIAMVVVLAKVLNPFWGGVFTMYPAVSFSALITFHFYYTPQQLPLFFKKAPMGTITLIIYALVAMLVFPRVGLVIGTLTSYLASLIFSLLLIRIQKRKAIPVS